MNLRPNDRTAPAIQCTISNKLLAKPGKPLGQLYKTFKTDRFASAYDKAIAWATPIEEALAKGFVPAMNQEPTIPQQRREATFNSPTFFQMLRDYENQPHAKISNSFKESAGYLLAEISETRFHEMTMEWVHKRLDHYKDVKKYAPGTVKKRIETLSNIHAYARTQIEGNGATFQSICDQLPMNYSKRPDHGADIADADRVAIRPLTAEREKAIRAVFTGEKEIPAKSVPSLRDPKLEVMFTLISNTGLRLQEAYMLQVSALNFKSFIITVGGSKGWYGVNKPRQTMMRKQVRESLQAYIAANNLKDEDFLFREGWWDGDCASANPRERQKARKATSSYLSGLFRALYKAAGVEGITEHDLRHEATIRFIEMEHDGKPIIDREKLKKMMGWTSDKMVSHYLSKWRPDIGAALIPADL